MNKIKSSRSRTPRAKTRQSKSEMDPILNKSSMKDYKSENQILIDLKNIFEIKVLTPIQKLNQFSASETPARCILHNNIITLYCEFQRQPLCASCMYQSQTHRHHRVMPVQKAQNMIKEDITAFHNKLMIIGRQLENETQQIKKKSIQIQKNYENTIMETKKFYRDFKELIDRKEKEHLSELEDLKQNLKIENNYICKQIQLITQQIMEYFKKFSNKSYENKSIVRRCAFQILNQSKFITAKIKKSEIMVQQNPQIDFKTFNNVFQTVSSKLNLTVPILGQKKRKSRTGFHFEKDDFDRSSGGNKSPRHSDFKMNKINREKSVSVKKEDQTKKVKFRL